jgi:hypothetical protein
MINGTIMLNIMAVIEIFSSLLMHFIPNLLMPIPPAGERIAVKPFPDQAALPTLSDIEFLLTTRAEILKIGGMVPLILYGM